MAVKPIRFHLLVSVARHARRDGSAAGGRPSRKCPVALLDFRANDFEKLERTGRLRFVGFLDQLRRVAVEHKNQEPGVFRVMALPAASIARRLDLNSFTAVLHRVSRKLARRQQIGMTVVIAVLHQRGAKTWNRHTHKLADKAAKIRRHHEGFQPAYSLRVQPAVDETQETQKFFHAAPNVVGRQTIRKARGRIKTRRVYRRGRASFPLRVFFHGHDTLSAPDVLRLKADSALVSSTRTNGHFFLGTLSSPVLRSKVRWACFSLPTTKRFQSPPRAGGLPAQKWIGSAPGGQFCLPGRSGN